VEAVVIAAARASAKSLRERGAGTLLFLPPSLGFVEDALGGTEMKLRVKWVKSAIGYAQDQKDTIRALGLRKLQRTIEVEDNSAMRGMLRKVSHLVQVEEIV